MSAIINKKIKENNEKYNIEKIISNNDSIILKEKKKMCICYD